MVLGMLAALLGLGGISEKIKSVLETIQKPVNKVINSVVGTIVKAGKNLLKKMGGKKDKKGRQGEDPQRSAKVRAAVKADLDARLRAGMKAEEIAPAIRAIYGKRKPEGLATLEVVPTPHHPGTFDVYVAASEKKVEKQVPIATPPELEEKFTTADLRLHKSASTAASAVIILPDGTKPLGRQTSSGEDEHAEAKLLNPFRLAAAFGRLLPDANELKSQGKRASASLVIKVTRSPCPNCAAIIAGLSPAAAAAGWQLSVSVQALGLYSPRDQGTADQPKETGDKVGVKGLQILEKADVKFSVLQITDITLRELKIEDNPQLRKSLEKKARKLKTAWDAVVAAAKVKVGV
jgi:hypothetical protein